MSTPGWYQAWAQMSEADAARGPTSSRDFRRLWLGNAVSLFGDWFTYVAVGALVVEAGEGLVAVAIVLLGHSLPRALLAPWAGRIVDRHDRRTIMIVASLLRALTVLAMIAAARAESLVALQALVFVRIAFSAFIDPAATAILPQLVEREHIAKANAILSATWSVMFGVGVVAGGVVTALGGPMWSMAIDAGTFVISAGVFASLPRALPKAPSAGADRERTQARAWSIAWARPEILQAALGKLPASLANGGAWVLLHQLAGTGVFGTTAMGLGMLHAARAVGTGVGPLIWVRGLRASVFGLRASVVLTLVGVASFALAGASALAIVAALLWGVGSGANWVTASTRMQILSDNDQLGRVASVDLVAFSLAQSAGGLVGAWLADTLLRPELSAWVGVAGGLLGWLGVGALVRLSGRRADAARKPPGERLP
jgi:MFS family permease